MPQSRNDHAHDRDLDVRPGLIEDEKIETFTLCELHAGAYLGARVEAAELRAQVRVQAGAGVGLDGRAIARCQIGMVLEPKQRNTVLAGSLDRSLVRVLGRGVLAAAFHEADGQELVELGHSAQQSYPRIE